MYLSEVHVFYHFVHIWFDKKPGWNNAAQHADKRIFQCTTKWLEHECLSAVAWFLCFALSLLLCTRDNSFFLTLRLPSVTAPCYTLLRVNYVMNTVRVFVCRGDTRESDEMRNSDRVTHCISYSESTLLLTRDLRSKVNICPWRRASAICLCSARCRKPHFLCLCLSPSISALTCCFFWGCQNRAMFEKSSERWKSV